MEQEGRRRADGWLLRWTIFIAVGVASNYARNMEAREGRAEDIHRTLGYPEAGELVRCMKHEDCKETQFCQADVCSVGGIGLPCPQCRECTNCVQQLSVDRICPVWCKPSEDRLMNLQGLFTQLDEYQCIVIWFFEHDTWARHETNVNYADAISFTTSGKGKCSRTGNTTNIQRGVFALRGLSIEMTAQQDDLMSRAVFSGSITAIPWGVKITWSSGLADDLVQYNAQPPISSTIKQGATGVLPISQWTGTISMFDTVCIVTLQMFPLIGDKDLRGPLSVEAKDGIVYFWRAVTTECEIGPSHIPVLAKGLRRNAQNKDGSWNGKDGVGRRSGDPSTVFKLDLGPQYELVSIVNQRAHYDDCGQGCFQYFSSDANDDGSDAECWIANSTLSGDDQVYTCECKMGYMRGGVDMSGLRRCIDANECWGNISSLSVPKTSSCHEFATCSNTRGSFTCTCDKGFRDTSMIPDGTNCADVNECLEATHDCHEKATCTNTKGSFTCSCVPGYLSTGIVRGLGCQDIDECPSVTCVCNSRCINTPGSFECVCMHGFVQQHNGHAHNLAVSVDWDTSYASRLDSCSSTSEIKLDRAWSVGRKVAFTFSWKLNTILDPKDIIIVDKGQHRKIWWMYISAVGSGCSEGQQVSVGSASVSECHLATKDHIPFGSFSVYQDSAGCGTYYVRLYSHARNQIVAVDEHNIACNLSEPSALPNLGPDEGYEMKGGPVECGSDHNASYPRKCSNGSGVPGYVAPFCEISIPTFAGYVETTMPLRCGDGKLVYPDEQCDDGNSASGDGCDASCLIEMNSKCVYIQNSQFEYDPVSDIYTVSPPESTCVLLFCGDGTRNLDEEECDDGNSDELDGCSQSCKFTAGFTCERKVSLVQIPGSNITNQNTGQTEWKYDKIDSGEVCTPFLVNLQVNGVDPPGCPKCSKDGECLLYNNSKVCRCKDGFSIGDEAQTNPLVSSLYLQDHTHVCFDFDECLAERQRISQLEARFNRSFQSTLCPLDSVCSNTLGGFACTCNSGLETRFMNGKYICQDVNECDESVQKINLCHWRATCSNSYGSYECYCPGGLQGTGLMDADGCSDVDECLHQSHDCPSAKTCVNSDGSFSCHCPLSSQVFTAGKCYESDFLVQNNDLFEYWGRTSPSRALQGLVKFWQFPHHLDADVLSTWGIARWWFLSDRAKPQIHNSAYMVPPADTDLGDGWISTRTAMNPIKASLPWNCSSQRQEILVTKPEGDLSRGSFNELDDSVITWYFRPSETIFLYKPMYCVFSEFNFIHKPESLLEEEVLSFCSEATGQQDCQVFNASHPPRNPVIVLLPFKLYLSTPGLRPDTSTWNMAHLRNNSIMFQFTFGVFEPKGPQPQVSPIPGQDYVQRSKNAFMVTSFSRPIVLGISNKDDAGKTPPCSVNRKALSDDISSMKLNPVFKETTLKHGAENETLNGMWTGSCNPRVPPSGPNCHAALKAWQRHFELQISGCDGFGVPDFATGLIMEDVTTEELRGATDKLKTYGFYRRFTIRYASGGPSTLPGDIVRGSYKFFERVHSPERITININAGQNWYPGDRFPDEFERQTYPCQIIELGRIFQEDADAVSRLVPIPDLSVLAEIKEDLSTYNLYAGCKGALERARHVINGIPGCAPAVHAFFSINITSWSMTKGEICNNPCLEQVVQKMSDTHSICSQAWNDFQGLKSSSLKIVLRDVFAQLLVHVAEFFFRFKLACTGNYKKLRCNQVLTSLHAKLDSECRVSSNTHAETQDMSSVTSAVQLLQLRSPSTAGSCNPRCRTNWLSLLVHGHCCLPTIQEEHSKWLGSVLPKDEDQISINTSEYIEKFGSTQQGQGTNTSETVTIKRPSGSCPGPMEHSLKCAFDSCAQTDLWPKACCPAIDCKNGGTLDYVGICFCRCKIPFVGVYCAEEASQVYFAVRVKDSSIISLNVDKLRNRLELDLALNDGVSIEISYIDIFVEDGRDNSTNTGRRITRKGTLEIGMRILIGDPEYRIRMMTILRQSMETNSMSRSFRELEIGELHPIFIIEPTNIEAKAKKVAIASGPSVVMDKVVEKTSSRSINMRALIISLSVIGGCLAFAATIAWCSYQSNYKKIASYINAILNPIRYTMTARGDRVNRKKKNTLQREEMWSNRYAEAGSNIEGSHFNTITNSPQSQNTVKISARSEKYEKRATKSIEILMEPKDITISPDTKVDSKMVSVSVDITSSQRHETPRSALKSRPSSLVDLQVSNMSSPFVSPRRSVNSNAQSSPTKSSTLPFLVTGQSLHIQEISESWEHATGEKESPRLASWGGEDGSGRIDTLLLRQQRLQLKLREIKPGKSGRTSSGDSGSGAPSLWSPPQNGFSSQIGQESSIQLTSIPTPRRLQRNSSGDSTTGQSSRITIDLKPKLSPFGAFRPAAKKSQVWSPRNLYPSDPSIAGGSVGADTHRSQSSVIEFSALEPQGDRVREGSEKMTARNKSATDFRVEWLDASGSSLNDEDSSMASSRHLSGMDGNSDFNSPSTSPEYLPNDSLKSATGGMGVLASKRRSELKLFY